MGYTLQVLALIMVIVIMLLGPYCGVVVFQDYKNTQDDLAHLKQDSFGYDSSLIFPIQYPARIQASSTYTMEIYARDVLETWSKRSLTQTEVITFSIDADPRMVHLLLPRVITVEVPPTPPSRINDPIEFAFEVRNDVYLQDIITVECHLDIQRSIDVQKDIPLPVYNEQKFVEKHLWQIVLFIIAALLWIILFTAILARAHPYVALAFVVILLVVLALLFPQIRYLLELFFSIAKSFF